MKKHLLFIGLCLLAISAAFCGCSGATASSGKLQSMSAYPQSISLAVGEQSAVNIVFTPSDAKETSLIWVSSNTSVATVDSKGIVSAISSGACVITAASTEYSNISSNINVTVSGSGTANQPYPADQGGIPVGYIAESDPSLVYPNYYLSEGEAASMGGDDLQFAINQIYAKNGYIFSTDSIQNYFSHMSWYSPRTSNASALSMSGMDKANLNLLVKYRDALSGSGTKFSGVGCIWSYRAVSSVLSESYVSSLSAYDVQLLINTIYAKNGYIFDTDSIQAMFNGQYWYYGTTSDMNSISFSSTDRQNLNLLTAYR